MVKTSIFETCGYSAKIQQLAISSFLIPQTLFEKDNIEQVSLEQVYYTLVRTFSNNPGKALSLIQQSLVTYISAVP